MTRNLGLTGLMGAAVMLALSTTPASAISSIGNCELTDVTSSVYGAADACYGLVAGNISTDAGDKFYESLIPDTAFGGAFDGENWTVAAINFDTATHTWSGDLAGFEEVVIVLKQSTLWGAWYFNPAGEFGTWSTSWDYPNGNDNAQSGGLSHGFALVRGEVSVPEPATLGLLGLGMLGVGLARRRARAAK